MEKPPTYFETAFKCIHCNTTAHHEWHDLSSLSTVVKEMHRQYLLSYRANIQDYQEESIKYFLQNFYQQKNLILKDFFPSELAISCCTACKKYTYWLNKKIIWPRKLSVDPPNQDLSESIRKTYMEAASITEASPKGAAALLRLALQQLLIDLGEKGKNINEDIKSWSRMALVQKYRER